MSGSSNWMSGGLSVLKAPGVCLSASVPQCSLTAVAHITPRPRLGISSRALSVRSVTVEAFGGDLAGDREKTRIPGPGPV